MKKYNLFVYLPHIEPPPGYDESNSYPASDSRRTNSTDRDSATASERSIDFGFRAVAIEMDDAITVERQGRGGAIETVSGVCGVPARLTGFASLIAQFLILVVSCALVVFFFFHIGGYAYFTHVVVTTVGNDTALGTDLLETTTMSLNDTVMEAHDDVSLCRIVW